jgi:hypothetical protein
VFAAAQAAQKSTTGIASLERKFAAAQAALKFPKNGVLPQQLDRFPLAVVVKGVTHLLGAGEGDVCLELEDIQLDTDEDGAWVLAYLDQGFGLVPELLSPE